MSRVIEMHPWELDAETSLYREPFLIRPTEDTPTRFRAAVMRCCAKHDRLSKHEDSD